MTMAYKCNMCSKLFEGFPVASVFEGKIDRLHETAGFVESRWKVEGELVAIDSKGKCLDVQPDLCFNCWHSLFAETIRAATKS